MISILISGEIAIGFSFQMGPVFVLPTYAERRAKVNKFLIILACLITITKPNIALEAERGLIPKMRNAASHL